MCSNVRTVSVLFAAAVAISGCNGDKPKTDAPPPATPPVQDAMPPSSAPQTPETVTFAPSLNVDLTKMTKTPSGVYYQDLVIGKGARADSGKTLAMNYTGWLANGTKFDSSEGRDPYQFVLGPGQVINGWHIGTAGMHIGGKRLLVIPSTEGYGEYPNGQIPANAVLVFQVELMGVK